jgi:hypothetical protein
MLAVEKRRNDTGTGDEEGSGEKTAESLRRREKELRPHALPPHRVGEHAEQQLPEGRGALFIEEPDGDEGTQTARGQGGETEDKSAGQEARGLRPETAGGSRG